TFPEALIEPCILAGAPAEGLVMDPFFGSGTVGRVAAKHNRNFIGIELNPGYIEISDRLLSNVQLELINHF
ncbi:site-specific DNA-methyltransferase, partial [Bacillus thuringiensis]|uniref:site-specific DNA-methyltransferase n=1 Tax=Bacillus thuringiensis TaxID=1428 RepID=UPI002DB95901